MKEERKFFAFNVLGFLILMSIAQMFSRYSQNFSVFSEDQSSVYFSNGDEIWGYFSNRGWIFDRFFKSHTGCCYAPCWVMNYWVTLVVVFHIFGFAFCVISKPEICSSRLDDSLSYFTISSNLFFQYSAKFLLLTEERIFRCRWKSHRIHFHDESSPIKLYSLLHIFQHLLS